MSPADFLRLVWPNTGIYAIAVPFIIPDTGRRTYRHKTFDTIDAAARFAAQVAPQLDVYFAVHTLREHRVWNPNQLNPKTKALGKWEVRVQRNMASARTFFFDLDVGEGTPRQPKYPTRRDALLDLARFCRVTGLPKPTLTSSGTGVHGYWPIHEALPSALWLTQAQALRTLMRHHGVRFDPMRITDTASVLRVPGTWNFKDRTHPRPVEVLQHGLVTPTASFTKLVDYAMTRAGIEVQATPQWLPEDAVLPGGLTANTGSTYDGPPTSFPALRTACNQVHQLVQARGVGYSEPAWFHFTNLIRFVERGPEVLRRLSVLGGYDPAEQWTDHQIHQLELRGMGPSSCAKLAEAAGDEACVGCVFQGKVKSPIVAARYRDPAPAPVLPTPAGTVLQATAIPDPPHPYLRMRSGGVVAKGTDKHGNDTEVCIYPHDLYPLRRLSNVQAATEQQMWCVTLPREAPREFVLDADALYDRRKFVTTIANHGIYPSANHVPLLQDYMLAYIAALQEQQDAETQCNHLGWTDEQTQFILPDRILLPDGTAKPAMLSLGAQRASEQVHRRGDLAEQIRLLEFFNHPGYAPNQFYILASLAAPLFHATGHHGVVVNASGEAGAYKSTTLYTAASLWGQPELYPINGTNNGATVRGRNERITTLANLPICVDEITNIPIKDAIDLVMGITQPGHRIRLATDGVERRATGSYKATIMLATGNNSLHGLLSTDNSAGTAGSMRVVEIQFKQHPIHTKREADAYWHQLKRHYGHVGEVFMSHVLQHRDAIELRVQAKVAEVDQLAGIKPQERFWSATIAAVLMAGEIARDLGLLAFDVAAIQRWALEIQVPQMRGVVIEEYASPIGLLAHYLEHINGNMLVTTRSTGHGTALGFARDTPLRTPHGQLLAHYCVDERVMYVLKPAFKEYCTRVGASATKVLQELNQPRFEAGSATPIRVVPNTHTRKVLGAGLPEFAKAQSYVFTINMAHPDVTGLDVVRSGDAVPVGPHRLALVREG